MYAPRYIPNILSFTLFAKVNYSHCKVVVMLPTLLNFCFEESTHLAFGKSIFQVVELCQFRHKTSQVLIFTKLSFCRPLRVSLTKATDSVSENRNELVVRRLTAKLGQEIIVKVSDLFKSTI